MAKTLKLTTTNATYTADLLAGTAQAQIAGRTITGQTDDDSAWIDEVIPVRLTGSTDLDLVKAEQKFAKLKSIATAYRKDPLKGDAVWFYENAANETGRRSFVKGLTFTPAVNPPFDPSLGRKNLFGTLRVTHHPAFEHIVTGSTTSANLSGWGGKVTVTPTAANTGTKPYRVSTLKLKYSGSDIYQIWAGFKDADQGAFGSFVPIWELEKGTPIGDCAVAGEAGASPSGSSNNYVSCPFTDGATMADRVTVSVEDVATDTNYAHFCGRYLVLLRAKVDSGVAAYVQMYSGFPGGQRPHQDIVKITATSYQLHPLGVVTIPATGYRSEDQSATAISNATIAIYAERTAGTGSDALHLDALALIPADNLLYAGVKSIQTGQVFYAHTHEDETWSEYVETTATGNRGAIAVARTNWELPRNPGGMVLVVTGFSSHSMSADMDLTLTYVPRVERYAIYS